MAKLGKFALWIIATVFGGWVMTYLWKWFIVPLGVPPITLFHALGINLMAGYLTFHYSGEDFSGKALSERRLAYACIKPIALGLIGYLYYSLMN